MRYFWKSFELPLFQWLRQSRAPTEVASAAPRQKLERWHGSLLAPQLMPLQLKQLNTGVGTTFASQLAKPDKPNVEMRPHLLQLHGAKLLLINSQGLRQ